MIETRPGIFVIGLVLLFALPTAGAFAATGQVSIPYAAVHAAPHLGLQSSTGPTAADHPASSQPAPQPTVAAETATSPHDSMKLQAAFSTFRQRLFLPLIVVNRSLLPSDADPSLISLPAPPPEVAATPEPTVENQPETPLDAPVGIAAIPSVSTTGLSMWAPNWHPAYYNAWNGAAFGTAASMANLSQRYRIMSGSAAPTRDAMIVIGVDASRNINGERWDGSSWSALPINPLASGVTDGFWWSVAVAHEQTSGNAVAVWDAVSALKYSVWNNSTWTTPATISTPVSGEPKQIRLAAKPRANEMVVVVGSTGGDYALVWSGSGWGNPVTLDSSTTDHTDVFVAYEQQSGRAMVVYGKDTPTPQQAEYDAYYRIWNGASWGSEGTISAPAGVTSRAKWLTLAADPTSNRIALGVLSDAASVWLRVWDGASWQPATTATSSADDTVSPNVAVAFESISGEALATYGKSGTTSVYYRTWNSAGGWSSEAAAANVGQGTNSMTLDRDPNSDQIMLSVQDNAQNFSTVLWSGSSWGSPLQQASTTGEIKNQPFIFLWSQNQRPGASGTLTFRPVQDTHLNGRGADVGKNYGSCAYIRTDQESDRPLHALLQFDLSTIPSSCTVDSASLVLQVEPSRTTPPGPSTRTG